MILSCTPSSNASKIHSQAMDDFFSTGICAICDSPVASQAGRPGADIWLHNGQARRLVPRNVRSLTWVGLGTVPGLEAAPASRLRRTHYHRRTEKKTTPAASPMEARNQNSEELGGFSPRASPSPSGENSREPSCRNRSFLSSGISLMPRWIEHNG